MEGDAADGGGLSQDLERVMDEDGQSGIAEGEGQPHWNPAPHSNTHASPLTLIGNYKGGCPAKLHFTSRPPH